MSWSEQEYKLVREFKLKDFNSIIEALNKIALVADSMDHHPDFSVYEYNKIRFELCTHSEGKVTQKDWDLAREIDLVLTAE